MIRGEGMAAEDAAKDLEVGRILSGIGEAAYRWTIADDRILWSPGAGPLLGLNDESAITTGQAYDALVDPLHGPSRRDVIMASGASDAGSGVPFQIEYAIRPAGSEGPLHWVEDTGRWYTDGGSRPVRAEGVVRIVDDRRAHAERLAFLSRHDAETGLFNRSYLLELLDEAVSQALKLRTHAAFLVVGIDNMKLIKEAYGLGAADRIAAAVAQRIAARLRDGDAIGRFTIYKLGILLNNCEEHEMAVAAERFIAAVGDEVIATEDGAMSVTISIGGVSIPRHARSRAEVTERAHETLELARDVGPGRFIPFKPSTMIAAERRANTELSRDLVGALAEGRLRVAYQPVIDAASRRTAYHEALLRLIQSDGTVALAAQVVPLIERLGLARLFDLAVLDQVLAALEANPGAVIAVNVSPETAAGPEWMARLAERLTAMPGGGARLIVEITEATAIRSLEEATRFITRLHELGVRLAIDDFGAGYTSFRSLRALAVDIVKIDGSFIENLGRSPEDQIFVRHLAALAHELGLATVAEWVRDETSAKLLASWGVRYLQGDVIGEATLTPDFGA